MQWNCVHLMAATSFLALIFSWLMQPISWSATCPWRYIYSVGDLCNFLRQALWTSIDCMSVNWLRSLLSVIGGACGVFLARKKGFRCYDRFRLWHLPFLMQCWKCGTGKWPAQWNLWILWTKRQPAKICKRRVLGDGRRMDRCAYSRFLLLLFLLLGYSGLICRAPCLPDTGALSSGHLLALNLAPTSAPVIFSLVQDFEVRLTSEWFPVDYAALTDGGCPPSVPCFLSPPCIQQDSLCSSWSSSVGFNRRFTSVPWPLLSLRVLPFSWLRSSSAALCWPHSQHPPIDSFICPPPLRILLSADSAHQSGGSPGGSLPLFDLVVCASEAFWPVATLCRHPGADSGPLAASACPSHASFGLCVHQSLGPAFQAAWIPQHLLPWMSAQVFAWHSPQQNSSSGVLMDDREDDEDDREAPRKRVSRSSAT